EATLDKVQGSNVWLSIGLREGKNREVRTILDHLGLTVNRLIRVSFGPFQLRELEPGGVEPVKRRVLVDQLGRQVAERLRLDESEGEKGQSAAGKGLRHGSRNRPGQGEKAEQEGQQGAEEE